MSDNVIVETATADCPLIDLDLSGATKDEQEAFVTQVDAYTDGYTAEITITMSGAYFTDMENNTDLEVAMGRNGDAAATLTAATFGLYSVVYAWTVTSSVSTGDGDAEGYFVGAAEVAASGDHDYAATGYANMYYNSDADLILKYAWEDESGFDTEVVADGYVSVVSFYMPKEPDTVPEDAEMADGEGDRFNKKETVWTSAGAGTPTALCGDSEKLVLGATTLVAGSIAFAAALAQ